MKSSAKGARRGRPDTCFIVDGYNVIGRRSASGFTSGMDMESERAWLLSRCAEYHAFSGDDVILVYDAHHTGGRGSAQAPLGVQVLYTLPQETADQRIERLVYDLRGRYRQVVVATSDAAEQQVAFGGGALRISAGEWLHRLELTQQQIHRTVSGRNEAIERQKARLSDQIRQDVVNVLEKWRRQ